MEGERQSSGGSKPLTLEDALKLIREAVITTVEQVFSAHKKEMEEYFSKRDQEMQAYFRKKDEEIEELKKQTARIEKQTEVIMRKAEVAHRSAEDAKSSIGTMVETFFENAVPDIFNKLGYRLKMKNGTAKTARNIRLDIGGERFYEVDIMAEGEDDILLLIEVKSVVNNQSVEEFIEKMKRVAKWKDYDRYLKGAKKIYGMIGGITFRGDAEELALKDGLIVGKYLGDEEVEIKKPEKVRDWLE